jgi:hypothetical protein
VPAGPAFRVRSASMVGECRADARKRAQIAEAPPLQRLAATWRWGAFRVGNVTVCRFVPNFVPELPLRRLGNRLPVYISRFKPRFDDRLSHKAADSAGQEHTGSHKSTGGFRNILMIM